MSSGAHEAFHPERVAYYEAAGWQAYYDHRWLGAFWLMVRLNREEFRMPLPSAELRARAAKTVDRITGRYSTDVAGDWRLVGTYLQQAYQAVPQG
jgi:hypothetical protein